MPPIWASSCTKHGVERNDAVYAIGHATYTDRLNVLGGQGGAVMVYIGPRHAQALPEDEIEILVEVFTDGSPAIVFHVQPLGAKFRRYREENPR